jgi:hypothetical protein
MRSTLTLMNVSGLTPIRLPFAKLGRISYIRSQNPRLSRRRNLSSGTLHSSRRAQTATHLGSILLRNSARPFHLVWIGSDLVAATFWRPFASVCLAMVPTSRELPALHAALGLGVEDVGVPAKAKRREPLSRP